MLFQDAPPDTSTYMIAGYAIFFFIGAIYLASLAIRRRNLEQDLHTLESLHADAERSQPAQPRQPRAPTKSRAARPASGGRKPGTRKTAKRR
jgi:hypothetical protein